MRGVTPYQLEILTHVRGASEDESLDFDQLLERLSWRPSKESAQFTIRATITKGLLEKKPDLELRRGRKRVCYRLTAEGVRVFDPRPVLEPEEKTSVSEDLDFLTSGLHFEEVEPPVVESVED